MTEFRYLGKATGKVPGYNGTQVAHGDVVDLPDWCAAKADGNPDYERVGVRRTSQSIPKKKVSRKKVSSSGQDQG